MIESCGICRIAILGLQRRWGFCDAAILWPRNLIRITLTDKAAPNTIVAYATLVAFIHLNTIQVESRTFGLRFIALLLASSTGSTASLGPIRELLATVSRVPFS